jgi:hypothetical protein
VPPNVPLLPILLSFVVGLAAISYAVVSVLLYTRWSVDESGITVRAAALLWVPLKVPWSSLERVQTVGWGGGIGALKLDGRYLFQRHVTLMRIRAWRVRFTPRDIGAFEAEVSEALKGYPEWKRTRIGWERCA